MRVRVPGARVLRTRADDAFRVNPHGSHNRHKSQMLHRGRRNDRRLQLFRLAGRQGNQQLFVFYARRFLEHLHHGEKSTNVQQCYDRNSLFNNNSMQLLRPLCCYHGGPPTVINAVMFVHRPTRLITIGWTQSPVVTVALSLLFVHSFSAVSCYPVIGKISITSGADLERQFELSWTLP